MIQVLSIFGDVMRIVTFQWHHEIPGHDERPHAKRAGEPVSPGRWAPSLGGQPFRRARR